MCVCVCVCVCVWVGFLYTLRHLWADFDQIWHVSAFRSKEGYFVISLRVRDQLAQLSLIFCHNALNRVTRDKGQAGVVTVRQPSRGVVSSPIEWGRPVHRVLAGRSSKIALSFGTLK